MVKSSKPVVLITGVSSGIGLATAKLFAAKGWIVVGTVRSRTKTVTMRAQQFDLQTAEMMRPRDLERVVSTAWRTYGRLDVVVCNAGYGLIVPLERVQYAQMSEQLAVNVLAPAELTRLALPLMKRQGHGAIVGISSIAGRVGMPGAGLYAASKFALEGLFESLSMELAASGVRMKLVEPSGVNTPFWKQGDRSFPVNRGLSVEAVAAAVFRAATDASARLRYPLGQTRWAGYGRRLLPEGLFLRMVRRIVGGT